MKTAAIIPVKSFKKAKTRLCLDDQIVTSLCKLMLKEILYVATVSPRIHHTYIVTKESKVADIATEFHNAVTVIHDRCEQGVNKAVALADKQVVEDGYDASIVIPQDIPYIKTQDIDFMMGFAAPPNFAIIVPSRAFNGTNALVRMPADLMGTHYDDNSYREHIKMANRCTRNTVPIFVRRVMMDVDTQDDIRFLLANVEKPHIAHKIKDIIYGR